MKLSSRLVIIALLLSLLVGFGSVVRAAEQQQQIQFSPPTMVVNTSFLNVRTGPGAQYTVLMVALGGTELPVLGVADDYIWYLVATPVGNGWVNVEYTLPRGNFTNVPLIDPAVVYAPLGLPRTLALPNYYYTGQGGGGAVIAQPGTVYYAPSATVERYRAAINVEAVNLRTAPSEASPTVGLLFRDPTQDFQILGRTTDRNNIAWIAINVPGMGSGWIDAPKLRIRLSARYKSVLYLKYDGVFLLNSPSGDAVQGKPAFSEGDEAWLLSISPDGKFVQVELGDGTIGWFRFDQVGTRTGTPSDEFAPGQPGYEAGYYFDQGGGSIAGYVAVPPVPFGIPSRELPIAIVNASYLNIRSGPGPQYTQVATVSGGTRLAVLATTPDAVWYLVGGTFGQGWLNTEFVLFRGDLNNLPIIRYEAAGGVASISQPGAVVAGVVTLYGGPGMNYNVIGSLVGPIEVPIVARTADFGWVQLSTVFGFGWAPFNQVTLRGDGSLIPIINP